MTRNRTGDDEPIPSSVSRMVRSMTRASPHLRRAVYYDEYTATELDVGADGNAAANGNANGSLGGVEFSRLINDLRLDAYAQHQQERVYSHGALNCVLRGFDDAIELNLVLSRTTGVMLSFDADAFASLGTFVDRCIEELTESPPTDRATAD